ncbi:galactose oxidase early set domain-containing protein [Nitrosopumilus sp. b2]|uniref:galactose oxidase early set domain-containing protein n=1 Tax=Nitrosopumilus sp. b2 TaxID=2109908 RepID=UPI0015F5409A|nr:galactose oxidase early set domain-containing protein [Nitrosopumilus sp. b2]KAF6244714.1 hypothetical protein C6989_07560 [Nitrosopumilus sp. b2]
MSEIENNPMENFLFGIKSPITKDRYSRRLGNFFEFLEYGGSLETQAKQFMLHAILLPDGKVMTMGSNPTRKCVEKRIEIFSPPYLFAGDRPVIDDVKSVLKYEESFEIQMHDGTEILDTALIRPSNTTHCLNPEQRYIEIDTVQNGDKISSKIPKNENLVPPGYYMLFVRNHSGVPCIAPFVRITH